MNRETRLDDSIRSTLAGFEANRRWWSLDAGGRWTETITVAGRNPVVIINRWREATSFVRHLNSALQRHPRVTVRAAMQQVMRREFRHLRDWLGGQHPIIQALQPTVFDGHGNLTDAGWGHWRTLYRDWMTGCRAIILHYRAHPRRPISNDDSGFLLDIPVFNTFVESLVGDSYMQDGAQRDTNVMLQLAKYGPWSYAAVEEMMSPPLPLAANLPSYARLLQQGRRGQQQQHIVSRTLLEQPDNIMMVTPSQPVFLLPETVDAGAGRRRATALYDHETVRRWPDPGRSPSMLLPFTSQNVVAVQPDWVVDE